MIRLLILAYDFPPYVSVGGLRPYSWFKYCHQFGIYPIVVTRQWANKAGNTLDYIMPGYSDTIDENKTVYGTTIRTPFKPNLANKILLKYGENKYRIIRKLVSIYYEFFQFLFPIGSKQKIFEAADDFLKQNKVDCIIATGDPFILFKYASKLSDKYSIPWIADYRDPWIQDLKVKNKIYRSYFIYFEKKILKNVSKITTVSKFIQKQIEENVNNKQFEILLNGFDPEILTVTDKIVQTEGTLSIGFTGTIEAWDPVESFLSICNELINNRSDFKVELHCYGVNQIRIIKELVGKKYKKMENFIFFYPKMNNLKFAESIANHNVFLLFNSYSILGTKIFDFLAIKRKIILCFENDKEALKLKNQYFHLKEVETESNRLQADMIEKTNSGIVVKDSRHLKAVLLELNKELKENGFIACPSVGIEKYSRITQVERLAEIIKEVCEK